MDPEWVPSCQGTVLALREGCSDKPRAGDGAVPENREFCLGFLMVQDLNLVCQDQDMDHVILLNN